MKKVYAGLVIRNLCYDVQKMFDNETDPKIVIRYLEKKTKELKGRSYVKTVWYEENSRPYMIRRKSYLDEINDFMSQDLVEE